MATKVPFELTAQDKTDAAFRSLQNKVAGTTKQFQNFSNTVKRSFDAVIAGLAVREITRLVTGMIDIADAVGKAASAAGLGAEEFQRFTFALQQNTGITSEQADKALQDFAKRLGQAKTQAGTTRQAFLALGVDLKASTSEALRQVVDGLATFKDAATRSQLAALAFSDEVGPKLAGSLKDGTRAMWDAAAAAKGIITDEQARRANDLNNKFLEIKRTLQGDFIQIVTDNADAIEQLAGSLAHAADWALHAKENLASFWDRLKRAEAERSAARHGDQFAFLLGLPSSTGNIDQFLNREFGTGGAFGPKAVGGGRTVTLSGGSSATNPITAQAHRDYMDSIKSIGDAADSVAQQAHQDFMDSVNSIADAAERNTERLKQLQEDRVKANAEAFAKMKEQSQAFGDTFANIMTEGADYGWDGVVKGFEHTIALLIEKAAAAHIFEALFPAGLAGGVGGTGFLGTVLPALFGAASGADFTVPGTGPKDSKFYPFMLSPGEQVSITPPGKKGSGFTLVQNVNIAAGVNHAEVASAMVIAKNQALIEFQDRFQRGMVRGA